MVQNLDEALKLTDDQKAKITEIYKKQADQVQALAPEDRRAKMQDIMKDTHDQIRALLTPEQQTKFDAMPPPGRGGRRGGGRRGGPERAEGEAPPPTPAP